MWPRGCDQGAVWLGWQLPRACAPCSGPLPRYGRISLVLACWSRWPYVGEDGIDEALDACRDVGSGSRSYPSSETNLLLLSLLGNRCYEDPKAHGEIAMTMEFGTSLCIHV